MIPIQPLPDWSFFEAVVDFRNQEIQFRQQSALFAQRALFQFQGDFVALFLGDVPSIIEHDLRTPDQQDRDGSEADPCENSVPFRPFLETVGKYASVVRWYLKRVLCRFRTSRYRYWCRRLVVGHSFILIPAYI